MLIFLLSKIKNELLQRCNNNLVWLMPLNRFGNSCFSSEEGNKIETSLFVQKLYFGTFFIESDIGVDLDIKNQFPIRNLLCCRKLLRCSL